MKSKNLTNELITFIPAILLVFLWGYAVISKLAEHEKFIAQMKLAPVPMMHMLGPVLGWLVPLIETVLIWLLFNEKYRELGLKLSFVLLLIFEIYISIMLLSGLDLPCTCGGLISKLQWKEHLIFNAFFMCVALFSQWFQWIRKRYRLNEYSVKNI